MFLYGVHVPQLSRAPATVKRPVYVTHPLPKMCARLLFTVAARLGPEPATAGVATAHPARQPHKCVPGTIRQIQGRRLCTSNSVQSESWPIYTCARRLLQQSTSRVVVFFGPSARVFFEAWVSSSGAFCFSCIGHNQQTLSSRFLCSLRWMLSSSRRTQSRTRRREMRRFMSCARQTVCEGASRCVCVLLPETIC